MRSTSARPAAPRSCCRRSCPACSRPEQGYEAARQCAINAIAQLKAAVGDLENVRRIVRVEGYVHCAPGFRQHPQVLNGASDLLNAAFGERGRHTRVAVGIADMPLDAPVQVVVWAEVA